MGVSPVETHGLVVANCARLGYQKLYTTSMSPIAKTHRAIEKKTEKQANTVHTLAHVYDHSHPYHPDPPVFYRQLGASN